MKTIAEEKIKGRKFFQGELTFVLQEIKGVTLTNRR